MCLVKIGLFVLFSAFGIRLVDDNKKSKLWTSSCFIFLFLQCGCKFSRHACLHFRYGFLASWLLGGCPAGSAPPPWCPSGQCLTGNVPFSCAGFVWDTAECPPPPRPAPPHRTHAARRSSAALEQRTPARIRRSAERTAGREERSAAPMCMRCNGNEVVGASTNIIKTC